MSFHSIDDHLDILFVEGKEHCVSINEPILVVSLDVRCEPHIVFDLVLGDLDCLPEQLEFGLFHFVEGAQFVY